MSDPDMINWDELAAKITAFYNGSGSWGLLENWVSDSGSALEQPTTPSPVQTENIEWEAEAARVLAHYEATGSWGNLSDWLNDTSRQPEPTPTPTTHQIGASLAIETAIGTDGPDIFAVGSIGGSRGGSFGRLQTGVGDGNRDAIVGFRQGEDVIDLSLLNWVSQASGAPGTLPIPENDLVFDFIGTKEFTVGGGENPELRFYNLPNFLTVLQMDGVRNAGGPPAPDATVDAEILFISQIEFQSSDFIL